MADVFVMRTPYSKHVPGIGRVYAAEWIPLPSDALDGDIVYWPLDDASLVTLVWDGMRKRWIGVA